MTIIDAISNMLDPTQGKNPQHKSLIEALAVALILYGHDPTNFEIVYDVSKMTSYLRPKQLSNPSENDYNKLDMGRPEIRFGFGLAEPCTARHPRFGARQCQLLLPHWSSYHRHEDEDGIVIAWPRQYNEYLEFRHSNNGLKYKPATKSTEIT